ncbi:hypothetical protein [Methylobacterium sp. Leaf361]|uniref:hypothetical protein n=1 Tax=Methylobacterium sp. Leaf361 TaxID=1736352 RepID=UPI0012FF4404|nr:hypothetical protein [Methylobacterium sp. Leaf361]
MSRPDGGQQGALYEASLAQFDQRCRADPQEALAALMEVLAWAGEEHARDPRARKGTQIAMAALCGFTAARGDQRAALMFATLGSSLADLSNGTVGDLVEPRRAKMVGNRPPDPIEKRRLVVLALECVRHLCSMEQCKAKDAREIVARWMNALPEFSSLKCTALKLKNWQCRYDQDASLDDVRNELRHAVAQAKTRSSLRSGLVGLGKPPS